MADLPCLDESNAASAQQAASLSERIYQHIYAIHRRGGSLNHHLRQCRKKGRKRLGRQNRRVRIQNRDSIEKRSPIVGKILSLTMDNGKEFSGHETVAALLQTRVYFAHPYTSWEGARTKIQIV